MGVLTTYRGVVEKGVVRLRPPSPALPEGAEVLVVAVQPSPSLEEQERRFAEMSEEEWRKPFDIVRMAWDASEPAPEEGKVLSDDELVALVHRARDER